jgi:hypothetical protein
VLIGLLLLTACGRTTVEYASVPSDTATTTTVPYDGRLHVAVVPDTYSADSACMCSWRMDPAPAERQPELTLAEVRASFEQSDFGRGQHPRYYFGLYSGSVPNPNAPDGRLTGMHNEDDIPAWLVVLDDQTFMPSGGGAAPGEPPPTVTPVRGWSWTQLRDAPGAPVIGGFEETGGEPPLVY